jgi:hypothetical protein
MWKVHTKSNKNNSTVKIDGYQLVQSLMSAAIKKQSSKSVSEIDNKLVCKVYINSFLKNMIEMTTIEKIVEISFILGRQYESFLNKNDVTFSIEEKENTDS